MSLFEVVTGQIRLDSRKRFFQLHSEFLLPRMKELGIIPKVLLITEIGDYGKFLDIYQYENFSDYENKTDQLLASEGIEEYYESVGKCIQGSINVSLMRELPYSHDWT